MSKPQLETYTVPSIVTGSINARLSRRYEVQRAMVEALLTPEALAALDAAEEEVERKVLGGWQ